MTKQVGSTEELKEAHISAKRGDWRGFGEFFLKLKDLLDKQIDLHRSTPFHYAAHCGMPSMDQEMFDMVDPSNIQHVLRMQDDMGNTQLHEVALAGQAEMAASILKYEVRETEYEPLLYMRNILGETPVYRAAALGNTNLLKHFVEDLEIDLSQHLHRTEDNMSILHTAVIDQHFGTALWLLKRHEELAKLKGEKGLTTLQLLAKGGKGVDNSTIAS